MNTLDNQLLKGLAAAQALYITSLAGWADAAKRIIGRNPRKIIVIHNPSEDKAVVVRTQDV